MGRADIGGGALQYLRLAVSEHLAREGRIIATASMLRIGDQKSADINRERPRSRQRFHFESQGGLLSIQSLELNFQFRHVRANLCGRARPSFRALLRNRTPSNLQRKTPDMRAAPLAHV